MRPPHADMRRTAYAIANERRLRSFHFMRMHLCQTLDTRMGFSSGPRLAGWISPVLRGLAVTRPGKPAAPLGDCALVIVAKGMSSRGVGTVDLRPDCGGGPYTGRC